MGGRGSVGLGGSVQLPSLVVLGQKLQRGVIDVGGRGWRVEDERGCRAVGCVGRGFGECEQFPVPACAGFMATLCQGKQRRLRLLGA